MTSACAGGLNQTSITCPTGRTLLDGVCVSEPVADYVACVRAQGAQLGAAKSEQISADAGYLGAHVGGTSELSESLEKKYAATDATMLAIVSACNARTGVGDEGPRKAPSIAVATDCAPPRDPDRLLFQETFEAGAGSWTTVGGGPVVLTKDADPGCRGFFQRETLPWGGYRAFSRAIPVSAGPHCVSVRMRMTTGSAGFIAVYATDAAGKQTGQLAYSLIGAEGYQDPGTPVVVPITSDNNWHEYSASILVPEGVQHLSLADELWADRARGAADFDDLRLYRGPCPGP